MARLRMHCRSCGRPQKRPSVVDYFCWESCWICIAMAMTQTGTPTYANLGKAAAAELEFLYKDLRLWDLNGI